MLLEPIFNLMYYMGFTWESFGMGPLETRYRIWFIKRLQKEIEKSQGEGNERMTADNIEQFNNIEGIQKKRLNDDTPNKSFEQNTADIRRVTNKQRTFHTNSRMNRPLSNY